MEKLCEEVQLKTLNANQKRDLLAEMRRAVVSKLGRSKASLEAVARKKAKQFSCSKEFKEFRSQIQSLQDASKETIDQLGKSFNKEDAVFLKEQTKLSKAYEKASAKIDKEYDKEYSAVQTKRNKLGTGSDRKISAVRKKSNCAISKVQDKMQDKFGDKLIYVSFDTPQGAISVKPVQLRETENGIISDHTEIMDSVDTWNAFRVQVFAHPDYESVRKDFEAMVKKL